MIERLDAPDAGTLARLARIHQAAFAPHARGWSASEIGALASDGALYAGDQGFILLRRVLDEAEILTIAVAPSAQGHGAGKALLAFALRDCGAAEMFLEVAQDNAAAIALYKSAGFAEVGRRKGYYVRDGGAPVDAIVMRRQAG